MNRVAAFLESSDEITSNASFWQRIANDESLRNCDSLAKLLAGCEIIAALDGTDLLAA